MVNFQSTEEPMKAFHITPASGVTLFTPEIRDHLSALGVLPTREFVGYVSWSEITTSDDGIQTVNGPFIQFVRLDDDVCPTTIGNKVFPRAFPMTP